MSVRQKIPGKPLGYIPISCLWLHGHVFADRRLKGRATVTGKLRAILKSLMADGYATVIEYYHQNGIISIVVVIIVL